MVNDVSVLTEVFGSAPLIKVIDFFLTFREFDYSKTQIAEEVEISRITMEKLLPKLLKVGIIITTRKVGAAQLYKLNVTNPRVKALIEMDIKISAVAARHHAVAIQH